jgi:ribosomal-protein-alanine N-acetyltransferase
MAASDVDQVLEIEAATFPSPWERRHFELTLRPDPQAINRVAHRARRVIAYLCARRSARELKINNLAVREDCRRRGLGRWMLARGLAEGRSAGCRTALLEVRSSNVAALGLYAEFGFEEQGRIEGYYSQEGEDALVLRATLGSWPTGQREL